MTNEVYQLAFLSRAVGKDYGVQRAQPEQTEEFILLQLLNPHCGGRLAIALQRPPLVHTGSSVLSKTLQCSLQKAKDSMCSLGRMGITSSSPDLCIDPQQHSHQGTPVPDDFLGQAPGLVKDTFWRLRAASWSSSGPRQEASQLCCAYNPFSWRITFALTDGSVTSCCGSPRGCRVPAHTVWAGSTKQAFYTLILGKVTRCICSRSCQSLVNIN